MLGINLTRTSAEDLSGQLLRHLSCVRNQSHPGERVQSPRTQLAPRYGRVHGAGAVLIRVVVLYETERAVGVEGVGSEQKLGSRPGLAAVENNYTN